MTHDELLTKLIFEKICSSTCVCGGICFPDNEEKWKALIAVVELHKPHHKYKSVCSGCYEEESGFSDYPCPTIQQIIENLK